MPILDLPVGTKQSVMRTRLNSRKVVLLDFADSPPEILGRPTPEPVMIEEGLTVGQLLKGARMLEAEAARRDKQQSKLRRQT